MKKVNRSPVLMVAMMLIFSVSHAQTDINEVYAGNYQAFQISDGKLWAWGDNEHGELGDGTTCSRSTPVRIGTDSTWVTISPTFEKTFGIKANGTLWGWGNNFKEGSEFNKPLSLLGLGNQTEAELNPVQIGIDTNWKSVSSGASHTVAVKSDGTLWAWGGNELYGSLIGCGSIKISSVPIQVGKDLDWKSVSAGSWHTIALKTDGTIWTWGHNDDGQLGDGNNKQRKKPEQILPDVKFKMIKADWNYTTAIALDGSRWAWGSNSSNQLGIDGIPFAWSPRHIEPNEKWQSIASTIGIKEDGTVWKWGYINEKETHKTPTKFDIGTHWKSIVTGSGYALGLATDGTLWGWGDNTYGQLGMEKLVSDTIPKRIVNTSNLTSELLDLIGMPDSIKKKFTKQPKGNKTVSVLRFKELLAIQDQGGSGVQSYLKNKNYELLKSVDATTDVSWSPGNQIYINYDFVRKKIVAIEYSTVGANYLSSLTNIINSYSYYEKTESNDKSWQYAWRDTDAFIVAKEFVNEYGNKQVTVKVTFRQ